jgi:UDP-N-acetylglucosamine 2-epimerase (non-hydrolysing)
MSLTPLKILIVCGTRPEIIKLAPVYHFLCTQNWCEVTWLHTGQHQEMAEQILDCFDIVPNIVLTRAGSSLSEFSIGCRQQLDAVMESAKWGAVIVQGDTESAFLGGLAAFYQRIPVAHVEAGLRTYDLTRPFPEEGLRQMLSRITQFHFPPTEGGLLALIREAIPEKNIVITGNTVVDAQKWVIEKYQIHKEKSPYQNILVTMHRRENWGSDIEEACTAIASLAKKHPNLHVLFPVHLNPVVKKSVDPILGNLPNVSLVNPLGYLEMQQAIADAWLILTDSGGIQEEAPTFQVPVLVLRKETERPEAVQAGCAKIIGTSGEAIIHEVESLLSNASLYTAMKPISNPFGDGRASERIAQTLQAHLSH